MVFKYAMLIEKAIKLLTEFFICLPSFKGKCRLILFLITSFPKLVIRKQMQSYVLDLDTESDDEKIIMLDLLDLEELKLIDILVKDQTLFVDIGANVGIWSLYACSKGFETMSIEPNISTFSKLKNNVTINEFAEIVDLYNIALSDKKGKLFFEPTEQHTNSKIVERENSATEIVDANTLDNILSTKSRKVSLIKIDAEGHEYHILLGSINVIKSKKPAIIIEFNGILLGGIDLKDWNVHQFLIQLDYKPFLFSNNRLQEIDETFCSNSFPNIVYVCTQGEC